MTTDELVTRIGEVKRRLSSLSRDHAAAQHQMYRDHQREKRPLLEELAKLEADWADVMKHPLEGRQVVREGRTGTVEVYRRTSKQYDPRIAPKYGEVIVRLPVGWKPYNPEWKEVNL